MIRQRNKRELTMLKRLAVSLLGLASTAHVCCGRQWTDIVDPSVYIASLIDWNRVEDALEQDPFYYEDAKTFATWPPEKTKRPVQQNEIPTCESGRQLYKIHMEDSWGDGWGGTFMRILELPSFGFVNQTKPQTSNATKYTITKNSFHSLTGIIKVGQTGGRAVQIFRGSLEKGSAGDSYVCLQTTKCYQVLVSGGDWQSEVTWNIQKAYVSETSDYPLKAQGSAPTKCQFSIVGGNSTNTGCPLTCDGPVKMTAPTQSPSLASYAVSQASQSTTMGPTMGYLGKFRADNVTNVTTAAPSTATVSVASASNIPSLGLVRPLQVESDASTPAPSIQPTTLAANVMSLLDTRAPTVVLDQHRKTPKPTKRSREIRTLSPTAAPSV